MLNTQNPGLRRPRRDGELGPVVTGACSGGSHPRRWRSPSREELIVLRRDVFGVFATAILPLLLLACALCAGGAGAQTYDATEDLPDAPSAEDGEGPGTIDQWEAMDDLIDHLAFGTEGDPFPAVDPFWADIFYDAQQQFLDETCSGDAYQYDVDSSQYEQYCGEYPVYEAPLAYESPDLVMVDPPFDTPCGSYEEGETTSIYCPENETVYFNFSGGIEDAEEYGLFVFAFTIGHEWAHHVQEQAGFPDYDMDTDVALENHADCLTGVWAHSVYTQGHFGDGDIVEGIETAYGWGDANTGEYQTHGSAEERAEWFRTGFESGDPADCIPTDA
jgi:hypothetical protein